MSTLDEAVERFLAARRIAVAGVSRDPRGSAGNFVYRKLREAGYEVFPVNPKAEGTLEGDPAFKKIRAVPGGVEAAVVATHPKASASAVKDALKAGARHVWIHRAWGDGSISEKAVGLAEKAGVNLIAGACPMMYVAPVDPLHRCFRFVLKLTRKLPSPPESAAVEGPRAEPAITD